jgi:glycosyltransferase involved in cell wall biosynthesis
MKREFVLNLMTLAYGGGILASLKKSGLAKIQVPFFFVSELYYALKLVRKEKIDIIQSHWLIPSGLIGAFCKKVYRKKHISTELAAGLAALQILPFNKVIFKFIIQNSDRMTVLSSYIRERLLYLVGSEILRRKIVIIPLGIDTIKYKPDNAKVLLRKKYNVKSKNVILFIGRIVEKKGVKYLIKALPDILLKYPDTELIICGDGPLRMEIENFAKIMGLDKKIRFVVYVSVENIKIEYLSLSDILVVPSIITRHKDTEGLGVVILEGLSMGTAVIASDIGGIPDIITDGFNGFLVKSESSDDIVKKTVEILSDETLRRKFKDNGQRTVQEKFSWSFVISSLKDIYDN